MNLFKQLLTNNNCYKSGRTITPKGVMVHSTGANNPNLRRYVGPDDGKLGTPSSANWNQAKPGGVEVCVHAFIGKLADGSIATYQTLPWNMRGWHAGKGSKGSANNTHIGFEICEDGLKDATYFGKVYQEAVELTAYLCKKYNLDPMADGVVICHSEGHKRGIASNHADVMHWFPKYGKNMDTFRADVKKAMGGTTTTTQSTAKPSSGGQASAKPKIAPAPYRDNKLAKTYSVNARSGLRLRTSPDGDVLILMPHGLKVTCYGFYGMCGNDKRLLVAVTDSRNEYKKYKGMTGYASASYLI